MAYKNITAVVNLQKLKLFVGGIVCIFMALIFTFIVVHPSICLFIHSFFHIILLLGLVEYEPDQAELNLVHFREL